jgi:hypothetical protein
MSIIEFGQDLNNAEPPIPLPVGPYPAEIISAQEKTSGNGNRYLNVVFRINSESYPADFVDGDPEGTELHYNFLQLEDNGRNRWRMKQFLERVGAPISRSVDPSSLLGLTATVDITHNVFNEETRPQIARILAP